MTDQTVHKEGKAQEALARSAHWLADGNEAKEKGDDALASRCYDKSAFWLNRYNRLAGNL